MDDRKKRTIEETLVTCYENRMKIRSINGQEKHEYRTKEEIEQVKTHGVYVVKNGICYSILRVEGILYFIKDSSIYDIIDDSLEFSYQNIDDENRQFEVKSNGNTILILTYPRIKGLEDIWSKEDDLDMFAWISNIYIKGRLDNILQYNKQL